MRNDCAVEWWQTMTEQSPPRIPPRWFVRTAWVVHRALYRVTGGRVGLSRPRPRKYGMLRLHTIGRRTGRERAVIVAYYENDADLITLAMNGWGEPPPAWWLNLRAHPHATVDLVDGQRSVHARESHGTERERLWTGFGAYEPEGTDLDALAALRSRQTPVVVLEPSPDRESGSSADGAGSE